MFYLQLYSYNIIVFIYILSCLFHSIVILEIFTTTLKTIITKRRNNTIHSNRQLKTIITEKRNTTLCYPNILSLKPIQPYVQFMGIFHPNRQNIISTKTSLTDVFFPAYALKIKLPVHPENQLHQKLSPSLYIIQRNHSV